MRILLAACLLLTILLPLRARADAHEHASALLQGGADRSVATPAAMENADYLESRVRLLAAGSGARVFRQSFLITIPVVETCKVIALPQTEAAEPKPIALYPLLPMGGQASTLGRAGKPLELNVIYGKFGRLEDLRGQKVAGSLVALDINSPETAEGGGGWQRCAALGAAAIVFLGSGTTTTADFLNKSTTIPLGIPRLYCDDPAAVAWFQNTSAAQPHRVSAEVQVRWQEKTAENVICILPAHGPSVGGDWASQWVILQSRYDGASQIMSRAPGATQALNAGVLMDLAPQIARAPVHCGAVLVWTAGDEWNYRGTRAFLDLVHRGLSDPSKGIAQLQDRRAAARRRLTQASDLLQNLTQIADRGLSTQLLTSATAVTGARAAIEEELLRQVAGVEESLERARLSGAKSEVEDLKRRKQDFLSAAASVAPRSSATPASTDDQRIRDAAHLAQARWTVEVSRRTAFADALQNWPDIRAAMPGSGIAEPVNPGSIGGSAVPGSAGRDPLLLISLAFSAANSQPALRFGLLSRSFYSTGLDVAGPMSGFAQAFRRYAAADGVSRFLPESLEGAYALEALLPTRLGFSSDAAIARGMPAAAAATLLDANGFLDTPNDTLEHVHWDQVDAQENSLLQMLLGTRTRPGALADPLFYGRAELHVQISDQPLTLFEQALGETLPRIKAAGALIGGESEIYQHPLGPPLAATRRTDWYLTHADGTVLFDSVVRAQEAEMRLQAFEFDDDGRPTRALAANQFDARGMVANFYPRTDRPLRAMLFSARRLDAYGLFDPRYLDTLDRLQILDARRLDDAQFSNIYTRQGVGAVFMPDGSEDAGPASETFRWQLLASRGNVSNRMILINADAQNPSGRGFNTTDLAKIGPFAWRAALDFYTLDQRRKAQLEKFGIANDVIRDLQRDSQIQLTAASAAHTAEEYPAFLSSANALWSLQSQEYQNLIDTSNGIIKGVIFLLLGVIPFSYFLERLLIGAINVYRQIAWFGIFFALMTAGLWFHPAFRISSAPLMILLAFLILILSCTVVYILWGKFEEEIRELRGDGGQAAHIASFRRGAVVGAAIRLGLSNMRRRGMRTALTLVTLVLLTFTLLCFTSVRETVQVSPQEVSYWQSRAAAAAPDLPPTGILIRQRAWQDLPVNAIELARGLALPADWTLGKPVAISKLQSGPVATRWWYASQHAEQPWLLPVQSTDARTTLPPFLVSGLIGMDSSEADFLGPGSAIAPPPHDGCWLPVNAQKALRLRVGDQVSVMGYLLRVTGFFSPESFATLRQLTGDPFSPLDPSGQQSLFTGGAGGGGSAADQTLRAESSYRFLDPVSVAIVPSWITQQLGGRLTSIIFRPAGMPARPGTADAATFETLANTIARRCAVTIYASTGEKVLAINAAQASRPQNLGDVLVPMIIAGVIVLNTMLGAVSERTREIHVYTSVGLSPAHVGMLFLAEAAALGTLGVVFGYIFGQGLATVLSWTHWLPGVDLNYSSLSAIITMGLVLLIVMLSALWPARAASRLATPSLQRDWKLPRPVGDLIAVDLPFTVNETAAKGVLAFLAEFLATSSHAGSGRFSSDNLQTSLENTTQGPLRTLSARIWLAPYDLGVIQTMQLSIHPTDQSNVFDVHVRLTREAGNPGAWRRLNRPFVTDIRKQFLLWRALDHTRINAYVEQSETLFEMTKHE